MTENAPPPPIELSDEVKTIINEIAEKEKLKNMVMHVSEASDKGDNYMGQLFRVRVSDKKRFKTKSFIVKCAPTIKAFRENMPVGLIYERETNAYRKVLPALYKLQEKHIPERERFTHAKFYGSVEETEKESIILGDLAAEGFKMYNRKIPFDRVHLELVIKTLARFHATSFVMRKQDPEAFEELSKLVAHRLDMGDQAEMFFGVAKDKFLNVLTDQEIKKRADESIGNMYQKYSWFVDPKRVEPYSVICHGDCWINNFLFKYKNDRVKEMRFIDLQLIRLASPLTDLAYLIFACTDEELRLNCYESILDLYYRTLDLNISRMGCKISECYPLEVYKDQIKSTMPMGMLSAMMLLPVILCDKENVPDFEDFKPEEFDGSMYDNMISKKCVDRLNGVARDCSKYGYI